jgi:hypothetical protein
MRDDKTILVDALETAVNASQATHPQPTLLGPGPDPAVLDTLAAAIEQCTIYQAVAGQVIFSGGSGPIIQSGALASRLFSKAGGLTENVESAVGWFLKLLGTREATVLVKAAIWGFQLDRPVSLSKTAQITSFAALPDSYMKERIEARARTCYDGSAWMTPTYYDLPDAAYVEEVARFPYIRPDGAAFQRMNDLEERLNDLVVIFQAATVGCPVAVAFWFEYLDHDLEYAEWENACSWLLPEVHPRVQRGSVVDAGRIQANVANFDALPSNRRADLLRSMDRFRLSQCRRQPIDRVLDLTLAFEVAVSGSSGEYSPPSYKVSVRTAQAIGGALQERQQYRMSLGELYKLRNQATHGSRLKAKAVAELEAVIDRSSALYLGLMTRLLTIKAEPDWQAIELEALPSEPFSSAS